MEKQILQVISKHNRGIFVVFEGLDKSGKSTQTRMMAKCLNANILSFPDRTTQLGQMISDYLQNKRNMRDEVGEKVLIVYPTSDTIIENLRQGTNIVSDRYAYSGVAFSAAKGLPIQWCKDSDHGLPKPDFTFYLKAPIAQLCQRDQFGQERYENQVFQNKVGEIFDQISLENGFHVIDALKPKDVILNEALTIIANSNLEELKFLWN